MDGREVLATGRVFVDEVVIVLASVIPEEKKLLLDASCGILDGKWEFVDEVGIVLASVIPEEKKLLLDVSCGILDGKWESVMASLGSITPEGK